MGGLADASKTKAAGRGKGSLDRGPYAPGQARGSQHLGDGKGQGEQEGLQDLHLLDVLLARGRQDAQCAPR